MNTKQIWYQAVHWEIMPVNVVKETSARITIEYKTFKIGGIDSKIATRVVNKSGRYENYFKTWEGAHAFLMAEAERKVAAARRALEFANSCYGNVKGIKPPKQP